MALMLAFQAGVASSILATRTTSESVAALHNFDEQVARILQGLAHFLLMLVKRFPGLARRMEYALVFFADAQKARAHSEQKKVRVLLFLPHSPW